MKYKFLPVVLIPLAIAVLFACRKDGNRSKVSDAMITDPSVSLSIDLAKRYYHNLRKEQGDKVTSTRTQTSAGRPQNRKYILFKAAYRSENAQYTFVEAPLFYNQKVGSIIKPVGVNFDKQQDLSLFQAELNRLLIFKDKNTGQVNQRILTYVPDRDYLTRHHNDISHNQINKLDADFNRFIKYRDWSGRTLFVLRIENGKSVKRYYSTFSPSNKVRKPSTKGEVCQEYVDITIMTVCYYADPEGETEVCEDTIIDEYYHMECQDDGSGDPDCFYSGDCNDQTPPEAPDPTPKLNRILKLPTTLTPAQKLALENRIKNITSTDCLAARMYDYMVDHNIVFDMVVDGNFFAPAGYNPHTDRITYRDLNIQDYNIIEEFFHAYQNKSVVGGTAQYTGNGTPNSANVEFESKVMNDIRSFINGGAVIVPGEDYQLWLAEITDGGTKYPTSFSTTQLSDYFSFMQQWLPNSAYSQTVVGGMTPSAIFSLINTSTCSH